MSVRTLFNTETSLSTVTIKGHTFTGTDLVFEGFKIENSHNPNHPVVHLVELGSNGTEESNNLLSHSVTLTGMAAKDLLTEINSNMIKDLGGDHDHDHGLGNG
jgi:hypothetical protein